MEKIKVNIENKQKAVKIPTGMRLLMRRCCHAVLQMEQFQGNAEVDISIVDNDQIRVINNEQRRIDAVTDVLSFPLGENGVYDKNPGTGAFMLGDIVISVQRASEQAQQFGHSLEREVGYLTAHSMLHLLGYDHVQGGMDAVHMREKEETVMNELGLHRGYSYTLEGENVE
jgi:probable rRNA maturation factor